LQGRFSPLMGIACPSGRNSGDGKRKADGDVDWIAVRAEAYLPTNETLEGAQQGVVSGPPSAPDSLWGLPGVDVASALHTEATVFFVAAMDTGSTD
jgi:hypothetical protein